MITNTEPTLRDMDDYDKPLTSKKLITIGISFAIFATIYIIAFSLLAD